MKYSRNSLSRFIPILLVIVITIVAVAAVIAIGRSLLGGGSSTSSNDTALDDGRTALLSVDTSRAVRLTVRGPIVADERFRSYRVVITPDSRRMTTYEGYLDKEIETKRFNNSFRAYEELVYALDKRRMMDGRNLAEEQNDLRGICASKLLYQFDTLVNGEVVRSLWTTDCEGSKGSALANVSDVINMFLSQIPDGRKMANGVGLAQQDNFFKL